MYLDVSCRNGQLTPHWGHTSFTFCLIPFVRMLAKEQRFWPLYVNTLVEKGSCRCLRGLYSFPLFLLLSLLLLDVLPFSPQCASPLPSWDPDASTQSQFHGYNSSFVLFLCIMHKGLSSNFPVVIENSGFLLTSIYSQIR